MSEPFMSDFGPMQSLSMGELHFLNENGFCPKCRKAQLCVGTVIANGCNAECPKCNSQVYVSEKNGEFTAGTHISGKIAFTTTPLKPIKLWRKAA